MKKYLGLDVLEKATRTGTKKECLALAVKIQEARVSSVVGKDGAFTLLERIRKRIENAQFVARMGITIIENPRNTAGLPRAKSGRISPLK